MNNWERCVTFHGHECPGLALGYAVVKAAQDTLGDVFDATSDEAVVCISENDACGVDAVQVLSGCTPGKGNLIIQPTGKMAFSFYLRNSGRSVRFMLKADALSDYETREEKQAALLTRPWQEFYQVGEVLRAVPERARLFDSHPCASCGESTAEPWLRVSEGSMVCLDCFDEYRV